MPLSVRATGECGMDRCHLSVQQSPLRADAEEVQDYLGRMSEPAANSRHYGK